MTEVPCPECGKQIAPESELCSRCYADSIDAFSLPDSVGLSVCSSCGSFDVGEGWNSLDEAVPEAELVMQAVERELKAHVDALDPSISLACRQIDTGRYEVDVDFSAKVRGVHVRETEAVSVSIDRTTCTTCSRRSGGYYESIVQVRASGREPDESELERAVEVAYGVAGRDYGDRDTFVTKTQEVEGGVDVYMSTTKAGRQVAEKLSQEYGADVGESATLVGEREGDEVYRVTYAVELPRFVSGDIVEVEDDALLVESNDDLLRGTSLKTGRRESYSDAAVEDASKLASASDAVDTTVVSQGDGEIQVLDPETYETVTLTRPDYVSPDSDEVPAVSTSHGVYLVPERGIRRRGDA